MKIVSLEENVKEKLDLMWIMDRLGLLRIFLSILRQDLSSVRTARKNGERLPSEAYRGDAITHIRHHFSPISDPGLDKGC